MQDTVANVGDQMITTIGNGYSIWMIVAIIEFIGIVILLVILNHRQNKSSKRQTIKQKVKQEGEIDFGSVIDGAFNATKLYDVLKVKCHPDNFLSDDEKHRFAEELYKEITENQHNLKRLKELKSIAVEKLNIQ